MPYCPNCGQEVDETDRFCIQCGTNLEGRAGGGSHHAHDTDAPPGTMSPRGPGTAEFSTATLWGPVIVAALGVVQSLYFILAPDQVLTAAGFGEDLTTDIIIATGVLGLLMAFSVLILTAENPGGFSPPVLRQVADASGRSSPACRPVLRALCFRQLPSKLFTYFCLSV